MTLMNLNHVTLWQANVYYSLEYFVFFFFFLAVVGEAEERWWLFIHRFKVIGNKILSFLNTI